MPSMPQKLRRYAAAPLARYRFNSCSMMAQAKASVSQFCFSLETDRRKRVTSIGSSDVSGEALQQEDNTRSATTIRSSDMAHPMGRLAYHRSISLAAVFSLQNKYLAICCTRNAGTTPVRTMTIGRAYTISVLSGTFTSDFSGQQTREKYRSDEPRMVRCVTI
jgi:hypothetical protein